MSLPRVLIVDDHTLFAEGISKMLQGHYDVVGVVNDARKLPEALARFHPDLVLLDVTMPAMSGLDALRQLKAKQLHSGVIMLTMHRDPRVAAEALKVGASGYLLKDASRDELLAALEAVLNGQTYLTPALTREVLALMSGQPDPARIELTPRQREVLRLIVQGQRVKEIAGTLDLSPRSVEAIKYQIMQELNVHSTAALVRCAMENNLVMV